MKIVHTENSKGWGGQEIRILSEAAGMIERGHDVSLVCADGARIFDEARKWQIPVTALPIGRKNLRGLLAMRSWIAAHPADVINTHSSTDSWLVALAAATLRQAPPLVRTRHISAPVGDNAPTRWLYARAARRVVTTGESLRTSLIDALGCPPRHIVSIPTGIDTDRFRPASPEQKLAARARLDLPADAILIGIVATLRSWKGHADLIDAFAQLALPNLRLVIVGDGPQRQNLETRIAEAGLGDRARLVGHHDDVLPWLSAFDMFALPSYANEGVPQALIQAMSAGLPCVTTDIGAIPEIALPDRTALVVPPRDIAALATAIGKLAGDPDLRARLGGEARRHVEARFARGAMLDAMETVFREAIASR